MVRKRVTAPEPDKILASVCSVCSAALTRNGWPLFAGCPVSPDRLKAGRRAERSAALAATL